MRYWPSHSYDLHSSCTFLSFIFKFPDLFSLACFPQEVLWVKAHRSQQQLLE